jgi:hypothetical protein
MDSGLRTYELLSKEYRYLPFLVLMRAKPATCVYFGWNETPPVTTLRWGVAASAAWTPKWSGGISQSVTRHPSAPLVTLYITPCLGPTTQDTTSRPRKACALVSRGPTLNVNSSALEETARKAAKSKNDRGNPFKLPSKILAVVADPEHESQIYIAEAAGNVKRINLEVGQISVPLHACHASRAMAD